MPQQRKVACRGDLAAACDIGGTGGVGMSGLSGAGVGTAALAGKGIGSTEVATPMRARQTRKVVAVRHDMSSSTTQRGTASDTAQGRVEDRGGHSGSRQGGRAAAEKPDHWMFVDRIATYPWRRWGTGVRSMAAARVEVIQCPLATERLVRTTCVRRTVGPLRRV